MITNVDYNPLISSVSNVEIAELKKRFAKRINPNMRLLYAIPIFYFGYIFLSAIYSISFSISGRMGPAIVSILLVLSVSFSLYLYRNSQIKLWSKYVRLDKFTKANGMIFLPHTSYPFHTGMIFNIGSENFAFDQLICDKRFEIANYSFKVGSGRDKRKIDYGYIMIQLDRKLPHIVLDSHKNNKKMFGIAVSNLPVSFNKGQKLSLEGNFNSFFNLYVPKNYERDALYIFTPDLMQMFINQSHSYDAEIIEDRLYIYSDSVFDLTDANELGVIFNIINSIGAKTISKTSRYIDNRIQLSPANPTLAVGNLFTKSLPWALIIVTIIIILFGMIY